MYRFKHLLIALVAMIALPLTAFAHEVYVLKPDVIAYALTRPGLAFFDVLQANLGHFFFWTFISIWAFFTVLSISLSKNVERAIDPFLQRLKRYAPLVARATLGIAIIASAYENALFGPELPLFVGSAGDGVAMLRFVLMVLGALITVGLFTRVASLLLVALFAVLTVQHGWYMLTYANYLGEMITVMVLGNTAFALDSLYHDIYPHHIHRAVRWLESHAFLILRVSFGVSFIYASVFAKLIHAELALQVVNIYHLTNFFPFEPHFIVLGAFCIELLLGTFFIFGIEVRFAALFLLFWLTLSLLYFKESVWPHIVLAGVGLAIFMHGYDRYTIQWGLLRMRHSRAHEPTL